MMNRIGDWLDERLGWRKAWEAIFLRKIPKVNWLYTLGSATLFVALNQIITGILLTSTTCRPPTTRTTASSSSPRVCRPAG